MKSQAGLELDGIPEIVPFRLSDPRELFARRAARLRALAPGHALNEYLTALARLADAQQRAQATIEVGSRTVSTGSEFPLNAATWRRGKAWRQALAVIIAEMGKTQLPDASRAALARLSENAAEALESSADALLAGKYGSIDLAAAHFLGAALQVYWTTLAGTLSPAEVVRCGSVCPVCALPPVAGIVLGDQKLRYLVCGLCATEWHLPRLTCSTCGSTEEISYANIEGDANGLKAECCGRCRTYLKLFYLESMPAAEPCADDVATMALDLMMSEEGLSRSTANLFLLPGS